MPRKLKEWEAIRDNYYKADRFNIPYPGADSIVYDRASGNAFWERRRQYALSLIPTSGFTFDDGQIESFIRSAAEFEQVKEEEFLKKFYQDDGRGNGKDTMTDKFNILF